MLQTIHCCFELTPHWPQTAVDKAGAALTSATAREKSTVFISPGSALRRNATLGSSLLTSCFCTRRGAASGYLALERTPLIYRESAQHQ